MMRCLSFIKALSACAELLVISFFQYIVKKIQ
jgi:hypothetical protein